MNSVSGSLNRCYAKFCERNPNFHGHVSLSGHSLGSLILFDLLQNQKPIAKEEVENSEIPDDLKMVGQTSNDSKKHEPLKRLCSQQINYTVGQAGTGQPFMNFPRINFQPKKFFALGSPIGN